MKIILISEDSSKNAGKVIENIATKLIRELNGSADVSNKFDHSLIGKPPTVGNGWKSRREEVQFRQKLFNILLTPNDPYIFWHIDSDTSWSSRDKSENIQKYNAFVTILSRPQLSPKSGMILMVSTDNIFPTFPCYSIESWLYHFVKEIRVSDMDKPDADSLQPDSEYGFDEIVKIKGEYSLKDRYNDELSQRNNHERLYSSSPSYRAFFDMVKGNRDFLDTLGKHSFSWS